MGLGESDINAMKMVHTQSLLKNNKKYTRALKTLTKMLFRWILQNELSIVSSSQTKGDLSTNLIKKINWKATMFKNVIISNAKPIRLRLHCLTGPRFVFVTILGCGKHLFHMKTLTTGLTSSCTLLIGTWLAKLVSTNLMLD